MIKSKNIEAAVRETLEAGVITPDLGGQTEEVTNGVIERLS